MEDFLLVVLGVIIAGLMLLVAVAAFMFWRIQRSDEKKLAKRIAKLPFFDKISLAGSLFRDNRIPIPPRIIALALVLYIASPIDLVPDFIPVIGYFDDILIVLVGAGLLLRSIPRYIIEEHVSRYEERAREAKMLESARQMSERFTIRRATLDDIDVLVKLRNAMLRDAAEDGVLGDVSEALGNTREYFEEKLPAGEYVCFLGEVEGRIVGVGGMVLFRKPALPQSRLGREGYILSMLTLAEFRGKGIASAIMRELLASAREAGAGLVALKATDAGRRVYEKFGFTENPHYMQLKL